MDDFLVGFNRLDILDIWWNEALKYIEYIDNYNMEYETSLILNNFILLIYVIILITMLS
jgi:hypothetical protein